MGHPGDPRAHERVPGASRDVAAHVGTREKNKLLTSGALGTYEQEGSSRPRAFQPSCAGGLAPHGSQAHLVSEVSQGQIAGLLAVPRRAVAD